MQKLAVITGVDLKVISEFAAMNLFSHSRVLEFLVKHDWKILSRTKSYTSEHKLQALANEYNYSTSRIKDIVWSRPKISYFCTYCGQEISEVKSRHNGGLCDKCVVKQIKI